MKLYSLPGRSVKHLWKECIPVKSHWDIDTTDADGLPLVVLLNMLCKRCRVRLGREGWPR